jgi:transaldolase
MIGRIDDYLRDAAHDNAVEIAEDDIRCAGLAIAKRAYRIFQDRQYHAKICLAAMRGAYHMTRTAGADLILSISPKYQKLLLENTYSREEHIDDDIDSKVIDRLRQIPDFSRAYEPDGMEPKEFIRFGATQRTLSQFIESGWKKLESIQ